MRMRSASSGVTLIELAITIALVGILGALIIQFVAPVRSYIDSSRRAALADTADTALRRIARDLHLGLPNSVRVTNVGSVFYIELLLVRTGGRYRAESDPAATSTCNDGASSVPANDTLLIGLPDTCFKTLGDVPNIAQVVAGADYLVVFNLAPGTDKADAYQTTCGAVCNKVLISGIGNGAGSERIEFTAGNTFTFESPGYRFFIIEGPVSYICDPAAKTLTRRWGYTITDAQPTTTFTGGSSALMATGVSACTFTYDAAISAGTGLATLALTLSMQDSRSSTENVNLYHAVHVSNVP